MKVAVTTSVNTNKYMNDRAETISKELKIDCFTRDGKSINSMFDKYLIDYLLIVERDKLTMKSKDNELFWHPGTSVKKIWNMSLGIEHPLLKAASLHAGSSVLDCTLGYGSDAIILASTVGETGKVTGVEANKYIAYLTQDGLKNYTQVSEQVKACMNRIEVVHDTYEDFLSKQADNSFDVVYFDPMFRMPKQASSSMNALRAFAEKSQLTHSTIHAALRVCKKRVVVKERIGSGVFKELGIEHRVGEIKYGAVVYGYIEK